MKKIVSIFVAYFVIFNAFATHIVGGDITVKHISGNSFEVKLLFYRDCSPGSAAYDNSVTLGVYDKITNAQLSTFTLPKISSAVKPLGDACFTPSLCVEEGIFKATVTLANNANGCYISWQRCCRNATVDNIVNPLNAGMVFYAEIPNPALQNNSPVFGSYPKAYMCHGEVNLENFSATDADGDQLVYSLVTPLNGNATTSSSNPSPSAGPYSTITWKSPYSLSNIMGGSPNMAINPTTGIINATPQVLGKFVFAVRVEEYRNGVKIGEIRRDVQYQVIPCTNPNLPGPTGTLTCTNPTTTITCGSSIPNVTYSWTGPGIVSGANTSTPTVNAGGYYTVVTTQPGGCTNTSHILVNNNNAQPNLTTGTNLTLTCSQTSGIINASSTTSGVSYSWAGAGITSGGNSATPNINAAGTYTVTITNPANGCTKTGTITVTNNNTQPNLTTGNPLTLTCTTTSGTINANSTNDGATYSWAGQGITSGGNTSSPTVSSPNTYTVTVTNPANGCTKTATVTVSSNVTLPNLTTNNNLILTCTTTSGTINATSTTNGATFNWAGNGIVSGGNTNSPVINTASTYTVTVTDPANGCTKTATVPVTSNTNIPYVNSGSNLVLTCANPSGTITATSEAQGVNYSWSGPGINSGGNTASPTVGSVGTYTVITTDPTNGCTASTTVNVTNNLTQPNVTTNSSLTLTCTSTTGTINASSTTNGASYLWAGPGIVSGTSSASPSVNAPGSYTVTVTNPVNGCTKTGTVTVAQNITIPTAVAGPSITLTCANTSGTINANTNASDPSYSWSGAGVVSGGTTSSPLINSPGTYTVVITNPINGCTNTTTVNVQQNITIPSISTSTSPTLTCTSTTSTLNASSNAVGSTFSWNGAGIVSGANSANSTINAPGTYTVTVTDPANGCTNSASINVLQDISNPNITAGEQLVLNCTNPSGIVSAASSTNGVNYSWTGPNIVVGGNTSTPTVNVPGTYTVVVTNPTNGCTSTATVNAILDNIQPNLTLGSPLILTCTTPNNTISATSNISNVNYNWVGVGITSGATSASPNVNAAGTYTVTITNPANGCTNSGTIVVTENKVNPSVTPGNTITLTCATPINNLSATSNTPSVNYSWSGPGIISGATTATPLVNVIGTYTVVVTDPVNGCTSLANVLVNDNLETPNVTSGIDVVLTCTNTSAVVSASSTTPNVSYSWAGQNILSGNNNSSATVNSPGTYTVTVTNPINGCTSTATVTATIDNSLPAVNTSGDLTLTCIATSGTISASSPSSVSYSWSGPGIVSGNTSSNPNVNAAGTYTVTVTDNTTGCKSIATVNVIDNIINPNVSAGNPLTLTCILTSDNINVTSTTPNVNYNWSGAGIVSGGNTSNPIVNAPGIYTVVVTNPSNGCTSTASVNVSKNIVNPNVTPGAASTLTCTTTQNNINATSSTSNVSFNWSGPGIVSNGNTSSPTINSPGTYTVTVTDPTNGCTSTASVLVNNDIEPPSVLEGVSLVLTCTAQSGIISASSGTPNATFVWVGPNIVSNGNTASPTVSAPGTYTVTITNPVNGCTNTTTVLVSIDNSIPNVNTVASMTLNCKTSADTIFATSTTNGVNYSWAGPGIVSNGLTASPIVNTTGTYTVTVTNPITGCTNTSTVVVNNDLDAPELTAVSPVTLNCVITSDTLNATSAVAGVSYSWTGPGIVSGASTANPIINSPGIYSVVITDPSNGCTSTGNVTVNNNIAIPNVNANGNVTLTCTTTSSAISATSTTPNANYSWTGNGIISGGNTSSPTVNTTGTYIVTVTDPANGCTNSDTVTVNDNIVVPNVIAGPGVTFTCKVSSSYINAASTTPGVSYNWAGPGIVSFGTTPSPTINAPGTYTVTVTDPINGCTKTATVTAVTAPAPVASVSANITITLGNNTTLNASGGVTYLWTPSNDLSCSTCPNPIASPTVATTYCVKVTDQYGCEDSACVTVDVYDPCPYSDEEPVFPNVFSPNGDYDNDIFFIKDWNNECVVEFSIEIFNRWGLKMFDSNDGTAHWDGRTASGLRAPDGTYFYVIKMRRIKGELKVYKGSLMLVR